MKFVIEHIRKGEKEREEIIELIKSMPEKSVSSELRKNITNEWVNKAENYHTPKPARESQRDRKKPNYKE